MLKQFMFTCGYILHRLNPLLGTKPDFFLARCTFCTSSRLILAGAFRSDYVAACSTALRSSTEDNESGGYVAVPCPSKVTQLCSTATWQKF